MTLSIQDHFTFHLMEQILNIANSLMSGLKRSSFICDYLFNSIDCDYHKRYFLLKFLYVNLLLEFNYLKRFLKKLFVIRTKRINFFF